MDKRKPDGYVTDLYEQAKLGFLTKLMPTALMIPVHECFMHLPPVKTYLSLGRMCPMLLPKALPPKQGFFIYPGQAFIDWLTNHKNFLISCQAP
jgi:hypothetical protein